MKCPLCSTELEMSERNGIEIDYCQKCRGVWLDRGELDKIIERSTSEPMLQQKYREDVRYDSYDEKEKYYDKNSQYDKGNHYDQKKRKSFLGDLFDF